MIVHVAPPAIGAVQPLTVNGALVVRVTLVGADWLLRTVMVALDTCPWNVGGNAIDVGASVHGTTLVPLSGAVVGPLVPVWAIVSVAFSTVPAGAVGRNVTARAHDAPAATGDAQPVAA